MIFHSASGTRTWYGPCVETPQSPCCRCASSSFHDYIFAQHLLFFVSNDRVAWRSDCAFDVWIHGFTIHCILCLRCMHFVIYATLPYVFPSLILLGPDKAPEHAYHLLQNLPPERRVQVSTAQLATIFHRLALHHAHAISFSTQPMTLQTRKVPVAVPKCTTCDCWLEPLASHEALALTYTHGCETVSFDIARCPRCSYQFAGCWKVRNASL